MVEVEWGFIRFFFLGLEEKFIIAFVIIFVVSRVI